VQCKNQITVVDVLPWWGKTKNKPREWEEKLGSWIDLSNSNIKARNNIT
jgi:hypothetical protein